MVKESEDTVLKESCKTCSHMVITKVKGEITTGYCSAHPVHIPKVNAGNEMTCGEYVKVNPRRLGN
jgi:hypothetical protein